MGAYELAGKREINDEQNPSANTVWQVTGATSYANARALLDAAPLPTSFGFPSGRVAYLDSVQALELRDDEFFQFAVGYKAEPRPDFNETEYEFEISAPNEILYQAISTRKLSVPGKTAPEHGGALGVQADGSVQGIPQLTAVSTFSLTKHWPIASVTLSYQAALENLVGSVSSGLFLGRAAGTVKLLGARGRRSGDKFPISYQFGFRPNQPPYQYDRVTVTGVKGWDVVDVLYAWEADTTAKRPVQRVRAVYVHKTAPEVSFAGLGI